jgi:hypothetical protein
MVERALEMEPLCGKSVKGNSREGSIAGDPGGGLLYRQFES